MTAPVAAGPGVSAVSRPSPCVAQRCSFGPARVHAGRHSLALRAFPQGMVSVVPHRQLKHSEAALGSCHCGRVSESREPRQVWMLQHCSLPFLSSQDERHPKEAFLSAFIYDYFWGPSGSCTGPSTWRKRLAPASRTPWWPSWCSSCRDIL